MFGPALLLEHMRLLLEQASNQFVGDRSARFACVHFSMTLGTPLMCALDLRHAYSHGRSVVNECVDHAAFVEKPASAT